MQDKEKSAPAVETDGAESYPTASKPALFSLGRTVATPDALNALQAAGVSPFALLIRHQTGDWGDIPAEDVEENQRSLRYGWRLWSAYQLSESVKIWVITEADRSSTTLLLPDEY